ncbi:hypothetical protein J6590_008676 [Homalodisca vitripennis]|nr:hypothetical protein J6590_008676 [Homalodisca vitripennis]
MSLQYCNFLSNFYTDARAPFVHAGRECRQGDLIQVSGDDTSADSAVNIQQSALSGQGSDRCVCGGGVPRPGPAPLVVVRLGPTAPVNREPDTSASLSYIVSGTIKGTVQ